MCGGVCLWGGWVWVVGVEVGCEVCVGVGVCVCVIRLGRRSFFSLAVFSQFNKSISSSLLQYIGVVSTANLKFSILVPSNLKPPSNFPLLPS